MDVKRVLNDLVKAGIRARNLDQKMHDVGYINTPYADIYDGICDAVHTILGESGDFQDSVTHAFFSDQTLTVQQCTDGLFSAYVQNTADPELSGATKDVLAELSAEKGIPLPALINIILSEWALRQQYIRCLTQAI